MPSVEATTWNLVPALPRSVGLGPVSSPPRLARTEQLSTTTSQEVASGPARTIRTRVAWTQRSRAVALQSSSRRRKVEPEARPTIARSSRHCTPSRTKNRNASTTLIVGMGGRPVPSGRFSIWSMIPATNAAALDPMSASRCQRYGKQPRTQPDAAGSTTALPGFWKLPLSVFGDAWRPVIGCLLPWRPLPGALSWAGGAVPPGDPPATQPRAGRHRRRTPRRPPGLAARHGLRRHRQDHRASAPRRGRPDPGPLPRLQQGRPARGPRPLPRPYRLPHRAQPGLPRHGHGRPAAPPRAQARRPRRGRAAGDPGPRRPAPVLLGLLRDRDRARLHPRRYRARGRPRAPAAFAAGGRPRRAGARLGPPALGAAARPRRRAAARARRVSEDVAPRGRLPAGLGRGALRRRGPGR